MLALKEKLLKPAEYPGCSGSRNIQDNISDLKAQVAANHKVEDSLSVKNEKGLAREAIFSVALTSRSIKRKVFTSRCHVTMVTQFLDLNKPWSCKCDIEKKRTVGVYDFPVLDCTQDENGSPFFSSIVRQ